MEALVFGLIALSTIHKKQERIVPEPSEFQSFDLRTLDVRTIPETTLRADHLIGGDRIWRRSCPDRTTMRHAANPDSPQTALGNAPQ